MKTACITGITGQTGSYLCEMLLNKGYQVHGLKRRSSSPNTDRIDHLYTNTHPPTNNNLHLTYGDLTDHGSLCSWIGDIKPDLVFGLACQSHVRVSFDIPVYTFDTVATSTLRLLEAIRTTSPKSRFLQASSSEMFGSTPPPQREGTPFHPRSPYAVGKVAAYHATINYREAYQMFACSYIGFNHESPRRSEQFVSRKITRAATRIAMGLQDVLYLGNLDAKRDWSHAKDMCEAMYLIANADEPDDYVVASGEMHSVQEFVEIVFEKLNLDWQQYVKIDPKYFRPSEVDALCGDASKIRNKLGWKPQYDFRSLVDEMIECDLELAKREKLLLDHA